MSFNNQIKKVKNINLPLGLRICSLKECISILSFSMRSQFQTKEITYTNIKAIYFIQIDLNEDNLNNIANQLISLKKEFDFSIKEYSEYRKNQKLNGNRQVSNKDIELLKKLENNIRSKFIFKL